MNWTNFYDPEKIFARTVLQNPNGLPAYLIIDGDTCNWGDFNDNLCVLYRSHDNAIGIWQRPTI